MPASKQFACPSKVAAPYTINGYTFTYPNTTIVNTYHYGTNRWAHCIDTESGSGNGYKYKAVAQCRYPSETCSVADCNYGYISNDNDAQMNRVEGRHNLCVNTAYITGHVDTRMKIAIAPDRATTKTLKWWSHASTLAVRQQFWTID